MVRYIIGYKLHFSDEKISILSKGILSSKLKDYDSIHSGILSSISYIECPRLEIYEICIISEDSEIKKYSVEKYKIMFDNFNKKWYNNYIKDDTYSN